MGLVYIGRGHDAMLMMLYFDVEIMRVTRGYGHCRRESRRLG